MIQKNIILLCLVSLLFACGSNASGGLFTQPSALAVDSTNNRLVVLETGRKVFVLRASDRSQIGEQPLVNSERLATIYDLLPNSPIQVVAYADGSTTRLFVSGAILNDEGDLVLNRILVLDFDGTTFTEAAFSPIELDDSDADTTDTDNVPGGMLVDQTAGRIYITDSAAGLLYVFNAEDGSSIAAPVAIAGSPNKLSLANDSLFVANASTDPAERAVTVVDTSDLSTNTFDIGEAQNDISAVFFDGSYALLAKSVEDNSVLIRSISEDLATVTSVEARDSSLVAGSLSAGLGLTSSVGGVLLVIDSSGTIYGYVPQDDGSIDLLSFGSSLSDFAVNSIATVTEVMTTPTAYEATLGEASLVYMIAEASGDLVFGDAGSTEVEARF